MECLTEHHPVVSDSGQFITSGRNSYVYEGSIGSRSPHGPFLTCRVVSDTLLSLPFTPRTHLQNRNTHTLCLLGQT